MSASVIFKTTITSHCNEKEDEVALSFYTPLILIELLHLDRHISIELE